MRPPFRGRQAANQQRKTTRDMMIKKMNGKIDIFSGGRASGRLFVILLLACGSLWAQSARSWVEQGNSFYERGQYQQAVEAYNRALTEDPGNPRIYFNRGDALFKLEKYDEARESFFKVIPAEDEEMVQKAWYNIGNSFHAQNKFQEAVDAYKRALDFNPADKEAKYNLELTLRKMREQQKKKPGKQETVKPSEYAKKMKKKAEALVREARFDEALSLMRVALARDKTVAAFNGFINRLKDVNDINEGHRP